MPAQQKDSQGGHYKPAPSATQFAAGRNIHVDYLTGTDMIEF
jgi:hypothetical protein